MGKKKLQTEINQLEKRLDYNYRLLGVGNRAVPRLPSRRMGTVKMVGAALAGGLVLGALAPRLRGHAPKLLPLLVAALNTQRAPLAPPAPYAAPPPLEPGDPW